MSETVFASARFTKQSKAKAYLITGLVAATLDLTAALTVWCFIIQKLTPLQLLQGIASGVFGRDAFTGGGAMAAWGVLFHYIIAFSFTAVYFFTYPYIPFLQRYKIISGVLYGIVAWSMMSYIVLPLSNVTMSPFRWSNAIISITILMVCIGLPVSLLTSYYYSGKKKLAG